MSVKLSTLLSPVFHHSFQKLMTAEDAALAFKVRGMSKRINKQLKSYDEVRKELLNKYGEKSEDGSLVTGEKDTVKIPKENVEEFNAQLKKLQDVEVKMPQFRKQELATVKLNAIDLFALEELLEADEDDQDDSATTA